MSENTSYWAPLRRLWRWEQLFRIWIVASTWNEWIYGRVFLALFALGELVNLWLEWRLVYWTRRLHEAEAESIVLDAKLIVEYEYARYLDEL